MEITALKPVKKLAELLFARGRKVAPVVAERRFMVCLSCEHLRASDRRCDLCGCYMESKVRWSGSECKAGRWAAAGCLLGVHLLRPL